MVEQAQPTEDIPPVEDTKPSPTFVSPTPGVETQNDTAGGFMEAFNFTGVRPKGK